jgi:cytochrome c-type biogenesis protein CcsB
MAVLFIVFAMVMGTGTFIEHWYNTDTARILIYDTWWFEGIMVLFVINFTGNIKRFNLYNRKKWPVLLLHLAFILIILGAFTTRYFGFEGKMSIDEGEKSHKIVSKEAYFTAIVEKESKNSIRRINIKNPLTLSPVTRNDFELERSLNGTGFSISLDQYIMNAHHIVKRDTSQHKYLKIALASGGTSNIYYLKEGTVQVINNIVFSFNRKIKNAINILETNDSYFINSPSNGSLIRMSDKRKLRLKQGRTQRLRFNWLYSIKNTQFVFTQKAQKGNLKYVSNSKYKEQKPDDALVFTIRVKDEQRKVILLGNKGKIGKPKVFKIGDFTFKLSYGSKIHELPFGIRLNDFVAETYPGTEKSYSSFISNVTVSDPDTIFNTNISMNNVLDYKGYRFFQASFHPDEQGTILSVNHDFWGTNLTYFGYFLLYAGLLAILFNRNSRFGKVRRKLSKISTTKASIPTILLLLGLATVSNAQQFDSDVQLYQQDLKSMINRVKIDKNHASQFGSLVIQDGQGRLKPVNTFSSELLRKVYGNNTYNGLNADQAFISMLLLPKVWKQLPVINISDDNQRLKKLIGVPPQTRHVSLDNLFNQNSTYKLSSHLSQAYETFIPNHYQKDLINLDRKASLLNFALSGKILRVLPIPNHPNEKWVSFEETNDSIYVRGGTMFIKHMLPLYFSALYDASQSGDYQKANKYLTKIRQYQKKFGSTVRPSEQKIKVEILYNYYNVFEKLYFWYMLTGICLIILSITQIFIKKKWLFYTLKGFNLVIVIFFLIHTIGLITRWYISDHAPWSNGYESMIYVSWATMAFGLYLGRKSYLTLGASTFITAIILVVAHWNWMDPSISNLQPVLNSYWLMIHVAIIVGSYGPFTLGMILGIISLVLMVFMSPSSSSILKPAIIKINYIIELALTVGLVMLTVGNFLGGQWANESWGRYWGWDPKEVWALISIMVYAFIIHMRLVPLLKSKWLFSFMSVLGYYSILMTYFGVNFYLTGLHSYADGDKIVTPDFVYFSLLILAILGVSAYFKQRKYFN